jgi:hypothetical protein
MLVGQRETERIREKRSPNGHHLWHTIFSSVFHAGRDAMASENATWI